MADIPVQTYVKCNNTACVFRGEIDDCTSCFEAKCENAGITISPVDHRGEAYGPIAFVMVGPEGGRFPSAESALRELTNLRYLEAQRVLGRSGQAIAIDRMRNYVL